MSVLRAICLVLILSSCVYEAKPVPDYRKWLQDSEDSEPEETDLYDFEKDRTQIVAPVDMVLLYGGSPHRDPENYTSDVVLDYVLYTDRDGESHRLFDGILFLEFMDAGGADGSRTFVTGYQYNGEYLSSARKSEWQDLADYYFKDGYGLDAVETAVENTIKVVGELPSKQKVVIGIPEPITWEYSYDNSGTTTYWGELDGETLDFSSNEDRVAACKWFIDTIREKFAAKGYSHIDLTGFYWVAERSTYTQKVMPEIAEYLHSMYYSFCWIPYYNADGGTSWESFGFDRAYLQPNYFFNDSVPYSRLEDACNLASQYGMGLEVEFDGNALAANGKGYKLRDYMQVFRDNGVWESSPLAYYQGSVALRWLKNSSDSANTELYHELCEFIISRPIRDTN